MINPQQRNSRVLLVGLLGLVLLVVCALASPVVAQGSNDPCEVSNLVRDYLAPLDQLPEKRGFTSSGKLGFGPGALRVYPPRDRLIVVGKNRIEATGSLARRSGGRRRLGWSIQSRLEQLDRQGAPTRLVKTKTQEVARVASFSRRQFGFGSKFDPGIYRLTVSFSSNRKSLGSFIEYFRVVKPRSSLHLKAPEGRARPGATVGLRVENLGTVAATYSAYPSLYAPDGTQVPINFGINANLRPLLEAGYQSPCIELPLPDSVSPGDYRVVLRAKDRTATQAQLLSAPLHVAG